MTTSTPAAAPAPATLATFVDVAPEDLGALRAAVERASVKARRRRAHPGFRVEIVSTRTWEERVDVPAELAGKCPTHVVRVAHTVEVRGGVAAPISGWRLVGAIRHTVAGRMLEAAPGQTIPAAMRETPAGHCDHCGKTRNRRDSFVIRDAAGKHLVVGRSCLEAFTGGEVSVADVEGIFADILFLRDAGVDDREIGGGGFRGERPFRAEEIVTLALFSVAAFGWAPARFEEKSTRAHVLDLVTPPGVSATAEEKRAWREAREKAEAFRGEAAVAIAWILTGWTDDSEFARNLRVALGAGEWRFLGTVVAAVIPWLRHREALVRKVFAKAPPSAHVGTVGERRDWTLTVERVRVISGEFGESALVLFRDERGNVLKWFASRASAVEEWQTGDVVTIKATVKAHDVWTPREGAPVPQTNLTRAKLVSRTPAPPQDFFGERAEVRAAL